MGWPVRPPQWQKRHTPYRRVELYGVQAAALVPEQACEDWAYRSRGGGDRGAARSARGAQSCDRCRGVDDGAIKSAHECPARPDQRCAGAVHGETVATGTAATAATSAGSQPRAGHSSAVLPAASSECARSIGQAGDRRDPHARHPGTDQCQTTPTATAPTQLQHPRRRRRGRLGLVTSRPRTSSHVGGVN